MLEDVIYKYGGVEVTPMEVYTDMFRLGQNEIQLSNEPAGQLKANPVAYWKNDDKASGHFRIMFEDTFEETLQELQKADFSILNGITYFGRRNAQSHASKMYALIFDLDGVDDQKLNNFLSGAYVGDAYPIPNYLILSGHGVHLYYVFEYGIPLFPNIKLQLKELKYALTEKIWNEYTSNEDKKQFQGINQGFRVVGGRTKSDAAITETKAFRLNTTPFCLEQLNQYVPKASRIDETKLFREGRMTLAQAKKKYPEWYQKVVVEKNRQPKKWDIAGKVHGDNPHALYDWWLDQVRTGATYRHRYFNIMCMAIYAVKNDVPYDQLEKDALELLPFMNAINPEAEFTKDDVYSALECYDERYFTFPIRDIEKISGIDIPKNKRNGRKQAVHIRRITLLRDDDYPNGSWRNRDGAPTKEQLVREYRAEHPEDTVSQVAKALNLSRTTVYKWWDKDSAEKAKLKADQKKVVDQEMPAQEIPDQDSDEISQALAALVLLMSPEDQKKFFNLAQEEARKKNPENPEKP